MYQISNEKFGLFVTELRKKKNLTQKDLAENYMYQIKQLANGNVEFPIVKDTTPNITTPRLYGT